MYYASSSHQSMTCGYFVKKCAKIHHPRTYQVVCGDFNADLASDVALCDLLSEQGLLLASERWRFERMGWQMLWGICFVVPFFWILRNFCIFLFGKNDERKAQTFRCIGQARHDGLRFRTPTRGQVC